MEYFLKIRTIYGYENSNPVKFNTISLNPKFLVYAQTSENQISLFIKLDLDNSKIVPLIIEKTDENLKVTERFRNTFQCIVTEEEFNRIYEILK